MSNLIVDWILGLFRDESKAQAFLRNPEGAMREAGLAQCTPAQIHAVAATAAPSVAMGGGDPMVGLQRAVSNHHGIAHETFAPTFHPQRVIQQEAHTDVVSHNVVASPTTIVNDSHNVSLDFGDLTFGNKTTAVGDGAVAIGGNNTGDVLSGDGAVKGNGNSVNNGDIHSGDGSPVTLGNHNDVEATSQKATGDIIQDNKGPVVKDVKTDGGDFDLDNHTTVHGNQTVTDVSGDLNGKVDASNTHIEDSLNTNNSVHDSGNTTGSHNETGSHNATTDVTGFEGGDIGALIPGL
jgi:hypothetical protein